MRHLWAPRSPPEGRQEPRSSREADRRARRCPPEARARSRAPPLPAAYTVSFQQTLCVSAHGLSEARVPGLAEASDHALAELFRPLVFVFVGHLGVLRKLGVVGVTIGSLVSVVRLFVLARHLEVALRLFLLLAPGVRVP